MNRLLLNHYYQETPDNLFMQFADLAATTPNIIDLSIGDPDITTPSAIIEQAFQDAKNGHTHYTAANGSPELITAIQDYYVRNYHLSFEANQVFASVGALHGMYLALQVLINPGDEVILHDPYFSPYKEQVIAAGGIPIIIPTFEEDGFELNLTLLEQAITPQTKAIIINTPNNPTGAIFSKETLKGIATLAQKHNVYILSDEVYEAFCYRETFYPMAQFAPDHTLTFGSFSKSFAMTGWRLGYVIAPEYIIEAIGLLNENVAYSAPSISQQAGIYALTHATSLMAETKKVFEERIQLINQEVSRIPFLSMIPTKGSMYAFINISQTGLDSLTFAKKLLVEQHVLVIPGIAFGSAGENYIRIAATQPVNVLKKAFDKIALMND
ncbi:pyridoxal phosphate-dependent aminotransferase [Vagococcus xieshaowenii]|uniref:Aminotransferase n=1 Tax=Vagococcus xieshaowenii TaxID=2562451 RepID=A0A4Z0DDA3_9ENTE|nr:pyridoxal phosphate-dependent aminotransferase [Vagococcus xieshaowenii]QCA28433.1 pyridoxal phosphate-dependent aminotransferase [Vagococcus xieshaowenii]TFZ42811.1 pyridoxal phosphate-dependent aminotransferase [Vagococcus xieshaowenii]